MLLKHCTNPRAKLGQQARASVLLAASNRAEQGSANLLKSHTFSKFS